MDYNKAEGLQDLVNDAVERERVRILKLIEDVQKNCPEHCACRKDSGKACWLVCEKIKEGINV
jgi:hypothetical protein